MIHLAIVSILAICMVCCWVLVIVASAAAEIAHNHREDERP